MPLTPRALATVESFTAQLGLPARAAPDGSVTLNFATKGQLSITASKDGRSVLLSLSRQRQRLEAAALAQALASAGYDQSLNRIFQAGLDAQDRIYFSVGLSEAELNLPLIEICFQRLSALHDG